MCWLPPHALLTYVRARWSERRFTSYGGSGVTYAADPRVDAYIDALPDWQQAICREVRDLVHAADHEVAETINAPTVRTSYCRATSARCWRRRTTSTCSSTTPPSSLIRRESSPAATRTRARARCPSARANTSEDERFQAAAARWHARFVLEADLPLREAEGVMTLLCRLRGADRHIVRRRRADGSASCQQPGRRCHRPWGDWTLGA